MRVARYMVDHNTTTGLAAAVAEPNGVGLAQAPGELIDEPSV